MKNKPVITDDSEYLKYLIKEKGISDQIINNSRSMITIINRDYIYEKANTTFCEAHQVVLDTILGKSLSDIWGKDAFQNTIKNNIDLCFSGRTVQYEAKFLTPRAGERHFEVVFRPISLQPGKVTHLLAETFDIDDLKRSKIAIMEKEEEIRKIESNLPIGFLRCKTDGTVISVNRSFLSVIEYPAGEECSNLNFRDIYMNRELFDLHVESLTQTHSKNFGRVYIKGCSGREIPCRLSGFLTNGANGKARHIDFAIEDCSRELMLENRLLQAQKLETIGSLAGGIAHDFNNILATISGYSEMLQEDLPSGSESVDKVARIQLAVKKALSITNQILTFSRQVEQERVLVNIAEVIKETLGFVKSSVPVNIILKSRITRHDSHVMADPTQLFRVFLNLITNAFQAMETNGGTLTVTQSVVARKDLIHELTKAAVTDEYVAVSFIDTGEGMDASVMRRIFEPFFTTRDVGKGTGLGLSVIHGIVTELEGEIVVTSRKSEGSEFTIYLPVAKGSSKGSAASKKVRKILFVTGNKYESRVLSIGLESSGYDLMFADDLKTLNRILHDPDDGPGLVICMSDSKLIDQESLIAMIRKGKRSIPLVMLTDADAGDSEQKLINSGIEYQQLSKPVSLKEVRNAIDNLLRSNELY